MKKLEIIKDRLNKIRSKTFRLLGHLMDTNMVYTREMVEDLIVKVQDVHQCFEEENLYDENGLFTDDYDKNIEEWLEKEDQWSIHTKTLYPALLEYNQWCLKKGIRGLGKVEFRDRLAEHGIKFHTHDQSFSYDAR